MKKSASVRLTVVAAIGMGAAHGQQRQDPCAAASFKQQACQAAVQNRGYCWDGKWVQLTYHYPYPYYYDAYQQYTTNGGTVSAAIVGSCVAHGSVRAGFGATGARHGAGG
jgi:hypothetical protein